LHLIVPFGAEWLTAISESAYHLSGICSDRIDFTLYDILNYYQKNESKLIDIDSVDSSFFDSFGKKADGFYNFIEELELGMFVDKKKNVVLNLGKEKMQPIKNYEEYDDPVNNPFYLKNLYSVLGGSEIIDSPKS